MASFLTLNKVTFVYILSFFFLISYHLFPLTLIIGVWWELAGHRLNLVGP